MKDIVTATGLSKGAFYHYFKSKDDLFRQIVSSFFAFGKMNYQAFRQDTFKNFLEDYVLHSKQAINQLIAFTEDKDSKGGALNFFYIMFDAVRLFPDFLDLEMQMHIQDLEAWDKVIQKAKDQGEIQSNAPNKDIASLFLYCNDGLALRSMSMQSPDFMKNKMSTVFQQIYDGLI